MDLSLRDLADRSGVSAPMLSQVERGETSPTLHVAARIAAGLELRLSQLLRLDEDGAVTIVRKAERRKGPGRAKGHSYEILSPPLPGQRAELSRHTLAPGAITGGPGDPPMHEPGSRETALVESGTVALEIDGARHELQRRRLRDLRRGPAAPFREPRTRGGAAAGRGQRRPPQELGPMPQTLFDKIWEAHEVAPSLLYIDLHLVHEVTSPQAFDGLRLAGRKVRRRDRTLATVDHNVPTDGTAVAAQIRDELSRVQVETLERNCEEFGIPLYSLGSERQGIVHVIGPELGVTQPGMTIVCGDSHTATHGAFGALAFGIGTSEVEHVLATQCLVQSKPRSMRIAYDGELGFGVTAKDLILATIGQIGVAGRRRPRRRVRRGRDQVAVDGRSDDRLQHDDRGRGARRDDRPRRDHFRIRSRTAGSPVRAAELLGRAVHGARRRVRPRGQGRRRRDQPDGDVGHDPGDGRPRDRVRARAAAPSRTSGRSTTWA